MLLDVTVKIMGLLTVQSVMLRIKNVAQILRGLLLSRYLLRVIYRKLILIQLLECLYLVCVCIFRLGVEW